MENLNPIQVWSYDDEYEELRDEILEAVDRVFRSGRLLFELDCFESKFSKWLGMRYTFGVANGTDALRIALMALDVSNNDEVITVSSTAVPTVSAIKEVGAHPIFVDITLGDYNIDVSQVEASITNKTKCIICVHLYGQPANILELKKIAKRNNLYLIEDCAQSHGAKFENQKVGTFGDISCFSFYPTKILGGYGDAGACVTNSDKFAQRIKMIRFYGMREQYFSEIEGINSRMDEVHAAILLIKLKKLDEDLQRRKHIASFYDTHINNSLILKSRTFVDREHAYYLYVVRCKKRDTLISYMKENGVNLNISYPWPVHTMPPFSQFSHSDLPNSITLSKEVLSLPMYPKLTDQQLARVVSLINAFQ
jgi:aminotransferase EvaB